MWYKDGALTMLQMCWRWDLKLLYNKKLVLVMKKYLKKHKSINRIFIWYLGKIFFRMQHFEICCLFLNHKYLSVSSVIQSCPTLCDPMNRSTPGLSVHHHLPEFTQTHVHRVLDAIQPSHPWSSFSPPAPNPSQHQSLFQRVNSSHEVAKVLELQL